MSIKLGKAFNTGAEFWLRAQENYNLALALKKVDLRGIRIFWKSGNIGTISMVS